MTSSLLFLALLAFVNLLTCKGNYNVADDCNVNININNNAELKQEVHNLREETARLTERLDSIENSVSGILRSLKSCKIKTKYSSLT